MLRRATLDMLVLKSVSLGKFARGALQVQQGGLYLAEVIAAALTTTRSEI